MFGSWIQERRQNTGGVRESPFLDPWMHLCIHIRMGNSQMFRITNTAFLYVWKNMVQRGQMGVSKNNGTPKSSITIGFSHYTPSILGYSYFWKHPNIILNMWGLKGRCFMLTKRCSTFSPRRTNPVCRWGNPSAKRIGSPKMSP